METSEILMEEKYRMLFKALDEGFCIIEVIFNDDGKAIDWRYLDIDRQFVNQGGSSIALGKLVSELYSRTEDFWFDFYGNVAKSGVSARIENEHKELNKWYDIFAYKIGGPDSRKVGVLFRDITSRKRAEEKLQEREKRMAFLLKISDSLRLLSDPIEIEGTVTRMTMDHFGVDRCYYCEVVDNNAIIRRDASRNDLPSVAGVYPLSSLPIHKSLLDAGQQFIVEDVRTTKLVDEELRQLCIQLMVISYLDVPVIKDGKVVGILCVVQSNPRNWTESESKLAAEIAERIWGVAERARVENALRESEKHALKLVEKLKQADQNKNTFISMLSHELRNPLASIMISLDLIDKTQDYGKQAAKALEVCKRQGKQLTNLVDDLLDVTRITQNKIVLQKENVELNEIIKKAVEDYKTFFIDNNTRLEVRLTSPLYIEADTSRITQVIGNLLHNAAKFTRNNDLVSVTVSHDTSTGEAIITVQDTGRGIDQKVIGNLFEPFTQVDKSLDRSLGGLGLGLAIVKGMVDLHGGRVEVFSDGIDKGSTFTIRLPLTK